MNKTIERTRDYLRTHKRKAVGWTAFLVACGVLAAVATGKVWMFFYFLFFCVLYAIQFAYAYFSDKSQLKPVATEQTRKEADQLAASFLTSLNFADRDRFRKANLVRDRVIVEQIGLLDGVTKRRLASYLQDKLSFATKINSIRRVLYRIVFTWLGLTVTYLTYIVLAGIRSSALFYDLALPFCVIGYAPCIAQITLEMNNPRVALAVLAEQRDPENLQMLLDWWAVGHLTPLPSKAVYDALIYFLELPGEHFTANQLVGLVKRTPIYSSKATDRIAVLSIQRASMFTDPSVHDSILRIRNKPLWWLYPADIKVAVVTALDSWNGHD